MSQYWKHLMLGYAWSLPNTLIGALLMVTWYWPRSLEWRDGCLEVIPRRTLIGGPWVGAQTWGWIIFARDTNQASRGDLMVHERVHVVQAFIGGPLFLVAYGLHFLALWAWNRKGWQAAYYQVWAERQAYRIAAEYEDGRRPHAWGAR